MKKSDLEQFERILQKQRVEVMDEVRGIHTDHLHRNNRAEAGEISGYSTHMADMASDEEALMVNLRLLAAEEDILDELDEALRRISKGRYGQCEACGASIGKPRLTALPFARLCIDCQQHRESGR